MTAADKQSAPTLRKYDRVERCDGPLRSGAEWYPYAIVLSVEPLVLVSSEADMRWSHVPARSLRVIGRATLMERIRAQRRRKS